MNQQPEKEKFVSQYTKGQRVFAIIAVVILLAFTVCDIVLAIIGVPTNILMMFIVLTIFVPIVLFLFIKLLNKKNPNIHVPGEKRED